MQKGCVKLAVRSGQDLRGPARGRARRGSPADRVVHESGRVPAQKECEGGIGGDIDPYTWHSDARKWATEADVSWDQVTLCPPRTRKNDLAAGRFERKKGPTSSVCAPLNCEENPAYALVWGEHFSAAVRGTDIQQFMLKGINV